MVCLSVVCVVCSSVFMVSVWCVDCGVSVCLNVLCGVCICGLSVWCQYGECVYEFGVSVMFVCVVLKVTACSMWCVCVVCI